MAWIPKEVFPTPGGPQISVRWPLCMPPALAASSPGELLAAALAAKALSKSGRLVDTNLETLAPRSSRACAAEMVGRRSEHGVSVGSVTTVGGKKQLTMLRFTYALKAGQNCRRRARAARGTPWHMPPS